MCICIYYSIQVYTCCFLCFYQLYEFHLFLFPIYYKSQFIILFPIQLLNFNALKEICRCLLVFKSIFEFIMQQIVNLCIIFFNKENFVQIFNLMNKVLKNVFFIEETMHCNITVYSLSI